MLLLWHGEKIFEEPIRTISNKKYWSDASDDFGGQKSAAKTFG
jgi:hypothetical protein